MSLKLLAFLPLLLSLLIPASVSAVSVDDIASFHSSNKWHLGKTLSPGDLFTYRICDNVSFSRSVLGDGCYEIRMDFYGKLKSSSGQVWIVQAEIRQDDHVFHSVFLVDAYSFEIAAGGANAEFASSIQSTVFYLQKFAHQHDEQHLEVGRQWGSIQSIMNPDPELVITARDAVRIPDGEEGDGKAIDVFSLDYTIFETSSLSVSPDLPFPLSALMYSPTSATAGAPVLFSFELVGHQAGGGRPDDFAVIMEGGFGHAPGSRAGPAPDAEGTADGLDGGFADFGVGRADCFGNFTVISEGRAK